MTWRYNPWLMRLSFQWIVPWRGCSQAVPMVTPVQNGGFPHAIVKESSTEPGLIKAPCLQKNRVTDCKTAFKFKKMNNMARKKGTERSRLKKVLSHLCKSRWAHSRDTVDGLAMFWCVNESGTLWRLKQTYERAEPFSHQTTVGCKYKIWLIWHLSPQRLAQTLSEAFYMYQESRHAYFDSNAREHRYSNPDVDLENDVIDDYIVL